MPRGRHVGRPRGDSAHFSDAAVGETAITFGSGAIGVVVGSRLRVMSVAVAPLSSSRVRYSNKGNLVSLSTKTCGGAAGSGGVCISPAAVPSATLYPRNVGA